MTIVNIGSINRDLTFKVPHFPVAGETITVESCASGLGGKGLNQSVAIARAGGNVIHAGAVGEDGTQLLEQIEKLGVNVDAVSVSAELDTGLANVFVDHSGDNAIVISAGANAGIPYAPLMEILKQVGHGNWLLFQNEVTLSEEVLVEAKKNGLKIAYCAAPFDSETVSPLLKHIDILSVNEIELEQLKQHCPEELANCQFDLLVTLGERGAYFRSGEITTKVVSHRVSVVDTTGAGDTFFGYFLAHYTNGVDVGSCLEIANRAAAIQVTRLGAADSIPTAAEVDAFSPKSPTNESIL
ncbi:ribokinase [Marinomonas ushuaiensis DSM 15871]|uniref:Ribokinase n=1 Tax=Marinomonas ushuaiensis DSM 15871 TaxID=1122207 RepID=X7E7P1_9GAMM|nr:ribokinase [Marinomonas ushuaiensis]ETX11865.1 ribokinase [Marinomonas ushuaiensis DSM 15871]